MTDFATLKILCNQYLSINNEIISFIEQEKFDAIEEKIDQKDSLIKQISAAKKTVDFKDEESKEQDSIEQAMKDGDTKILDLIKELRQNTSEELGRAKKKVKVNNAYAKSTENKSGIMLDLTE